MNCARCKSPRTMWFVDGFGSHRIFCKTCHVSYPEDVVFSDQKRLPQFGNETFYTNFAAVRRS